MVLSLLRETKYQTHPCTENLIQHTAEMFDAFLDHPKSSKSAFSWAHDIMKRKYANDIRELSHKDNGWHFRALKTSEEQLTDFWIELNSKGIQNVKVFLAPVAAMETMSLSWLPPLRFAKGKVSA